MMRNRIFYALVAAVLFVVVWIAMGAPPGRHDPITITGRSDSDAYNGVVDRCHFGYDIVKDNGYAASGVYSVTVRCK